MWHVYIYIKNISITFPFELLAKKWHFFFFLEISVKSSKFEQDISCKNLNRTYQQSFLTFEVNTRVGQCKNIYHLVVKQDIFLFFFAVKMHVHFLFLFLLS